MSRAYSSRAARLLASERDSLASKVLSCRFSRFRQQHQIQTPNISSTPPTTDGTMM